MRYDAARARGVAVGHDHGGGSQDDDSNGCCVERLKRTSCAGDDRRRARREGFQGAGTRRPPRQEAEVPARAFGPAPNLWRHSARAPDFLSVLLVSPRPLPARRPHVLTSAMRSPGSMCPFTGPFPHCMSLKYARPASAPGPLAVSMSAQIWPTDCTPAEDCVSKSSSHTPWSQVVAQWQSQRSSSGWYATYESALVPVAGQSSPYGAAALLPCCSPGHPRAADARVAQRGRREVDEPALRGGASPGREEEGGEAGEAGAGREAGEIGGLAARGRHSQEPPPPAHQTDPLQVEAQRTG